jgi:hypothetical protein
MVALEVSAYGLGEEGSAGEVKAKHAKRERELNAILSKGSRKWFALAVEQYSIKGRGLAHLKRNGSKRG